MADAGSTSSLRAFVLARTGVPLGGSGSLQAMLKRSLGAPSFAAFWRHWNPIWGYALSRWVYRPARGVLPRAPAVLLTFVVSGAAHDVAVWLVRGTTNGLLALSFAFMGIGVLIGEGLRMDLSGSPWLARALVHVAYVGGCVGMAQVLLG